jgi:hypothetical protein
MDRPDLTLILPRRVIGWLYKIAHIRKNEEQRIRRVFAVSRAAEQ